MQPWREAAAWLAGVAMLLIALAATAWGLRLPDHAWEAARVLADAAAPLLSEGRIQEIVLQPEGMWKVRTALPVAGTDATRVAIYFVGQPPILQGLLAFPLLWALVLMGPKPVLKRLAWGTALLAALVLLQIAANTWLKLTVMLKGEPSFVTAGLEPPPFRVEGPSIAQWEWVVSNVAYYLAALFGPIGAPLATWAFVNWRHWRAILTRPVPDRGVEAFGKGR
jgi:hypothetical protein